MPFAPQFSTYSELPDPLFCPNPQGSPQDDQTESNVRDNASDVSSDNSQRFRSSSPSNPNQTFVGYAFLNVTSRFATHCQCPAFDVPNHSPWANPLQNFFDDSCDSVDLSPIRAFLSSLPKTDFYSKLRAVILQLLRQFSATSEPSYFPILPTSKNPLLSYVNPAFLKPMGDHDATIYLSLIGVLPTLQSILVIKYQTPLTRVYPQADAVSPDYDDFQAAVFLSIHNHLPPTYTYTPEPFYAKRAPAPVHLNVPHLFCPAESPLHANIICGMITHATSTVATTVATTSSSRVNNPTPTPPPPIALSLNTPTPT